MAKRSRLSALLGTGQRREMGKGLLWTLSGRFAQAGLALAIVVVAGRRLSTDELGAFLLLLSLAAIGIGISQLGLHRTVLREVGAAADEAGRAAAVRHCRDLALLGALVWAALVGVGAGSGVIGLLTEGVSVGAGSAVGLAVFTGARALETVWSEGLKAQGSFARSAFVGAATTTLAAVAVVAVPGPATVDSLMLALGAAGVVGAGVAEVVGRTSSPRLPSPRRGELVRILRRTAPAATSSVVILGLAQVDVLIASALLPLSDVGLIGIANRLIIPVGLPLAMANSVIAPTIAGRYAAGDLAGATRLAQRAAAAVAVPALGVLLLLAATVHPLLGLVFGAELQGAAVLVVIVAIGNAVSVLTGSCGVTLQMMDAEGTHMRITLLAGAMRVLLGCLGAVLFGVVGLAVSAGIAIAAQNLGWWWAARRRGVATHASPSAARAVFREAIAGA